MQSEKSNQPVLNCFILSSFDISLLFNSLFEFEGSLIICGTIKNFNPGILVSSRERSELYVPTKTRVARKLARFQIPEQFKRELRNQGKKRDRSNQHVPFKSL